MCVDINFYLDIAKQIFNKDTISFFTFIVSILTFFSVQPLRHSQNEIQIRGMISSAKNKFLNAAYQVSKEGEKPNDILINIKNAALEDYRNAYEEACAKYNDKKLDRKRFKKMYNSEIQERVERDWDFYQENKEKYAETLKVYNKWFKKNDIKTKIKVFIMNNKKILKKIAFIIIILFSIIGIWMLSEDWKNFISVILVVLIGCLIPFLFDEMDIVIEHLKQIKDNTDEANYTTSIDSYNQLILYFGQMLCSFLILNLNQEMKRKILPPESINIILNSLQDLVSDNFHFERDATNPVWQFDPTSREILIKAEGILSDLNRILMFLPKELNFSRVRYAPFINLQSGFYQLKNQLSNDIGSEASEAVMNRFLRDFIEFVNISNED